MKKGAFSILLIALCMLFLPACNAPSFTVWSGSGPQPEDCIIDFFDCLKNEQYEDANSLLLNVSTLGFDHTFSDELYSQMFDYLTDSRSYSIKGEPSVIGHDATAIIDLTVLDFRKVETTLSETVTAEVSEIEFSGTEVDDSMLDGIILSSLKELMQAPEMYYTTQTLELELSFRDGSWKIICSDDLYSALVGYIV